MNLYIGNKVVKYNENKMERLDNGKSVTNIVYRNGNEVIKIFKKNEDEEFYKYFVDCKFKLKVISTPLRLLYDENKILTANTSIYRDGINKFQYYYHYLINMHKDELLQNFDLLYGDIQALGAKEIKVCDLTLFNCIFKDGILYHIDYGSFKKSRNAIKINDAMYNSFVKEVLRRVSFLQNGGYPDWVLKEDRLEFLKKNMTKKRLLKNLLKELDKILEISKKLSENV